MPILLEANSLEDLDVIKEYAYFNRSLLFSCQNSDGALFFAVWVNETPEFERYLCVPVSQQRLDQLDSGAIAIRDAFFTAETGFVYEVQIPYANLPDQIQTIPCDQINPNWLPRAGFMLKSTADASPRVAS
jgi:hypothetical protein